MVRYLRAVVCLLLSAILLDYARGEDALMPMTWSGSGSGSGITVVDPPTCSTTSLRLNVNLFDTIVDKLVQLNCVSGDGYEIVFKSSEVGLNLYDSDDTAVFGDYYDYSSDVQDLSIQVCNYDVLTDVCDSCNEELSVFATISRHNDRLLPFDGPFSEECIKNADDSSRGVFLSNPIPFWGSYYTSVYLSTNGLLSFGRPFTQYWPVVFPYGRSSVPVLAPYWNDLDFRNDIEDSGLYYTTYVSSGAKRDEAILQEFSDRLYNYTNGGSADFKPSWMIVATWNMATPYYGRSNMEETLTFQVLLATDSVDTYAVFLYDGINWNRDSREIVVGYDSKNYINYLNVKVTGTNDFINIDSVAGNTGNIGEWYFHLSDPDADINSEQECFKWVARQEDSVFEKYFEALPSCPCTRLQARRDWRYWFGWRWGLSSGPNCATLIWSRRQSTIECCYDSSGALLVGGTSGGSYKLYHPLFANRQYTTEDKIPYEHCCQSSKLCSIFYTYRPSDDCSGYDPSQISFTWGDPHFQTVDGLTYTFNGYGEYILLHSEENDFTVQVRLRLLDQVNTTFNATVISAVVVVYDSVQPVQVEESDGDVTVYVNGSAIELSAGDDTNLIVTYDTTYSSFNDFIMFEQNFSTAEYISLRYNNDDLIIATSSGASVMVSNASSALHLAVEVDEAFINTTEGLLGYYNADDSDDFLRPDGTILSRNSSERELFAYGKLWHIGDEESSLFAYFDGKTYSDYNYGWDTHSPSFEDELGASIPDNAAEVCDGDMQCVFDYVVSNSISFATATHAITMDNQETQEILANFPPVIDGSTEVYVTAGETFTTHYYVSDEDSDVIPTIELKAPVPDDVTLDVHTNGLMASLILNGSELPSVAIQILANDSMGATVIRNISVILCACENDGECVNTTTPQFNSNGHYRQECECPQYFSGDLCETDERSCSETSCPESSICEVNSSNPAGFTCSNCQEGYELADDGKCVDIDECNTTNPEYVHNCTHDCNNTEGSYECLCGDGYEVSEDGSICDDIDECYEGTHNCMNDQMCNNTEGGFQCKCYYPETLLSTGTCNFDGCTAETVICNALGIACAQISSDQAICLCSAVLGTYCVGECEGDLATLRSGNQSCEECEPGHCGYRCMRVCDCEHGDCKSNCGCECDEGYEGNRCESEINEDTPEFAEGTIKVLTLSWSLPQGAVLAQFNATDSDVGAPGELSFSLSHDYQLPVNVSSGEGIFSINNETGVLVLVEDLNVTRGLYTRFALFVLVTDLGENPLSSEVTVSVLLEDTPAPIPRFNRDVYEVEIMESTQNNTTVLNFTCTEPEEATGTSNLTTYLTSSNDSQIFSLEGEYDDLMLILLEERDYEALSDAAVPHYTLEVTCSNQYGISTSASVEIEVKNVDDNSFEFDNSTYNVLVPENVPRYYQLLTVSAYDRDIPDGIITYDATNQILFSIFPNGTVYVADPSVDREAEDMYTLYVEAELRCNPTDSCLSSGEITTAPINITIVDINEGPPVFVNNFYISENLTTANTVGDVALVVTATDDDYGKNGSVVYSIEDNILFAIDNKTGEIYINNPNVISNYGSYVLEVYATDEGNPPMNSTTRVDIYVAPIPDRIVFRNLSPSLRIKEDRPRGYEIGTVLAEVVDRRNGTIVDAQTVGNVEYVLTPTDDSENFHIGRFTGTLILLNSLDFESERIYELNITASIPNYSESVIESTAIVEVEVTDVNDNAPIFSPSFYAKTIEEFTQTGVCILTVHADDKDTGINGNVTYSLRDSESVPFSVDRLTGKLEVNGSLDTPLDYRFYVVAKDGGTPPQSSVTVVFISVVRSASVLPEFDRHRYTFNVTENTERGTEIGTVLAQVAGNRSIDEYTHLQYRLQAPDLDMMNASRFFHIDPDSGNVSLLTAFDAERQDFYAVYVEVYNATGYVFDNATIEIFIEDINDNAPEFRQSLYTEVITTERPRNSILFNVLADDGDVLGSINSQIVYSLHESSVIGFGINESTGDIFVVNSTLFVGDYHMTALATDRGDPSMTGTAVVFIAVIPAEPQQITFDESEYTFNVSEDAEPETLVGVIVAQDHNQMTINAGSDLRYYFSDAIDFVCLTIGEFSGEIRVSCSLDRERDARYTLVVFAEYAGNQTGEVRTTVRVLDINDNHPVFSKDVYATVIETTFGNTAAILQVRAEDGDTGLNGQVRFSFSNDSNLFRIVANTGEIYALSEIIPVGDHRLTIVASDLHPTMPETSIAVVFICVTHERPTGTLQITTDFFVVDENNSPTGTIVGTVQLRAGGMDIAPENYEGNLEFSVGEDRFVINPNNGTLTVVGVLDREEQSVYYVEVDAIFREYAGVHASKTITITVGDLNDNSPIFSPSVYAAIIDNSYATNQTISTGDIIATDMDEGTNAELEFSLDELNAFGVRSIGNSVGEIRGEIYVQNAFLLEAGSSYLFNVIATDEGSPAQTSSATVYIEVRHAVPDNISFPQTQYTFNYTEHSERGTDVGRVVIEQDTPALDDLVYSVSGGSGLNRFHIDQSSGSISNAVTLDREIDTEFTLMITAQLPRHPLTATTSVLITILDINDHFPIFDRSAYSTVIYTDDIMIDSPLINISASDADAGANAAISYSISPNDTFRISESGSIFAQSALLEVRSHLITVEARDMGYPAQTGTTRVVIDVRQAIPESIAFNQSQYNFIISEYDTAGSVVGQVQLHPPLPAEFLHYRSFAAENSYFTVVPQSGVVQSAVQFDYEAGETTIEFETTCILDLRHENPRVMLTATASIRVDVKDENDNIPIFANLPSSVSHPENVTQEEMIAHIRASDADLGTNAELVFELTNEDMFRINGTTGELYVKPGLDREQQETHIISVIVEDKGTPPLSFQSDLTLTLLDINDNSPVLVATEFNINERVTGNVFQLEYSDSDDGEFGMATFTGIVDENGDRFSINSTSGVVTLMESLDFESEQTVTLHVDLADNPDDPSNSNMPQYTVTVHVNDRPDNVPEFDQNAYSIPIDPRIEQGNSLINVHATDGDDGDVIRYTISEDSGVDFVGIDADTGELFFTDTDTLEPGTIYEIEVTATDDSVYSLSSSVVVSVTIDALSLSFEREVYEGTVAENATEDHSIQQVKIQSLARSNLYEYVFTYEVKVPQGIEDPFKPDTFPYRIDILVEDELDREIVPMYILEVTATRHLIAEPEKMESRSINLTITVTDVNDNAPLIAPPEPSYSVSEDAAINTEVAQVTATDRDAGVNKELAYAIVNPGTPPFKIDRNGLIMVKQNLDFESQRSYVLTVQVEDSGNPPMTSTAQYSVEILNVNDRTPGFAASAYFGELYSRAPANSDIHHVVLEVTDEDGDSDFTFSISPDPADAAADDYRLVVDNQPPYYIVVTSIPDDAESGRRKFNVEVSDGLHKNTTILYLGVFTQEHLLSLTISGKSRDEFLSIVTEFLQRVSTEFSKVFGQSVSYYYDSLEESKTDTTVLIMTIYGWYGGYGPRYNNGKEGSQETSVVYITYAGIEDSTLNSVATALSDSMGFEVAIGDVPETTPTADTTQPTSASDNTALAGIVGGTAVAVLVLVLVIVVIAVVGRRRNPRKDKKDPYDRSFRDLRRHGKRPDSIPLTPKGTSSDLAYETMYDDDDMMNQPQTMPWFDPNYLAPNEEAYDGDVEQSSLKKGGHGLRATVDGDAKRNRRHSSDESAGGGSVTELDPTKYLGSYQQSSPMQPGQRMGEYDMFLNANARDSDKTRRPSLQNMSRPSHGQHRGTTA